VTTTPDGVDREHFAARSFFDISHRIADQLDGIAALLSDCLDLIEQCGLEEALQPHPGRYAVAAGLRDAAARLRVAGTYSSSATAPQPEARSSHTHDPARLAPSIKPSSKTLPASHIVATPNPLFPRATEPTDQAAPDLRAGVTEEKTWLVPHARSPEQKCSELVAVGGQRGTRRVRPGRPNNGCSSPSRKRRSG
jgi:hypothetical protein